MQTCSLVLFAYLTASRVRLGLVLAVGGSLVALLLVAWCFRLSHDARKLPHILFTGVLPLFFLALMWPQVRLFVFASLVGLLLSCFSKRCRRALRLLMMLFCGFIPLFLLVGVDDMSWAAGFLLVYLGLICLEPQRAEEDQGDGEDEMITKAVARRWHWVYCVSLGFLWILLFAALLWYVADPVTGV